MKETYYAPAQRTEKGKFEKQVDSVSHSPIMNTLLETMGGLLVVLNEDRQVVAINHTFLDFIGITNPQKVLGLRLGECLNCVHAHEKPHGCGTTPHCSTCGAVIALMTSINKNRPSEEICALTSDQEGVRTDMCLLVRVQPLKVEETRLMLVFAQDITHQQFWVNLERIFFHDIKNILTTLSGYSELLSVKFPEQSEVQYIKKASQRLCSEISLQESLARHKNATYLVHKTYSTIQSLKKDIDLMICQHEAGKNKHINATWPDEDLTLFTDPLLVSRVIGNMIINALEATSERGAISLTTKTDPTHISWEIWNNGYIPEGIQNRIFQRHFSTKSNIGRGLGTYSMKLFGEKYLKGEVSFSSTRDTGTTFCFRLPRGK